MSRSYKKFRCIKDRCGLRVKKYAQPKTAASRTVRRSEDIPNGCAYKKLYCSWDISDYCFLPRKGESDDARLYSAWQSSAWLRRKYGSFKRYRYYVYRAYRNK